MSFNPSSAQAAQESEPVSEQYTPHPRGQQRVQTRVPLHQTEATLRSELEALRQQKGKVAAALDRIDPTRQLRDIWLKMEMPYLHGDWHSLVDAETAACKASGRKDLELFVTSQERDKNSRRSHGAMLRGRLEELSRKIAELEGKLAELERTAATSADHQQR